MDAWQVLGHIGFTLLPLTARLINSTPYKR